MNPVITVVIPCYNGFQYMDKCLNALEKQTFRNFTVLVVDDCSTDDSYDRLLDYQKDTELDLRIIRNQVNQKAARSRQAGVSHADTEWMCFCDCDDWYECDFLEKMLNMANNQNADMVMCHFNYAFSDGSKKLLTGLNILSNDSSKKEFIAYAPMSMCRFIMKRKLFHDLVIPAITNAEDGAVTPQLLANCDKVAIVHEGLYNYYMRSGSASSNLTSSVYSDFCISQKVLDSTLGALFPEECEFLAIKNFGYGAVLNGLKIGIPIAVIKSDYAKFSAKYPDWFHNRYMCSLSKKRRIFLLMLRAHCFLFLRIFARLHSALIHKKSS